MISDSIETATATAADPVLHKAQAAVAAGDHAAALQTVLPFLSDVPLRADYLDLAVSCYWYLGDSQTALRLLQVLVSATPQDRKVWGKMGAMLLSMGEKDGAAAAFEHCLTLAPRDAGALGALNLIRPFTAGSHRAKLLKKLAQARTTSPHDKAIAWSGCARIAETAGRHGEAFRCFTRANHAKPAAYHAAEFDQLVTDQITGYHPADPPPGPGPRCVFVVGLPRSGTTLVEKILLRHPDVRSTGEGAQLQATLRTLRQRFSGPGGFWAWAAQASPQDLLAARRAFLDRIAVPAGAEKPFVINKLPLGCFDMGAAQLLLPGARFVFMARHPLDAGLSNFAANYHGDNHAFSHSLDGIAHMTRAVYRSLADYRPKLGGALRVQSFTALVTEPEAQIRALVDHAGLDWNDACLSPEDGGGAVRTASILQVREAINAKGLGKWRRYATQLQPLITALGPDWLAGWEAADRGAGDWP